MQTLRVITCSGIPQSSKRRGHEWPPKAARNSKLGVIFAKCAPMTPCPLLVQPLITAQVKTEGIIQIDFEFQREPIRNAVTGFNYAHSAGLWLSPLYAISHTLIHTLCLSKYAILPIKLSSDATSLQNLSAYAGSNERGQICYQCLR